MSSHVPFMLPSTQVTQRAWMCVPVGAPAPPRSTTRASSVGVHGIVPGPPGQHVAESTSRCQHGRFVELGGSDAYLDWVRENTAPLP